MPFMHLLEVPGLRDVDDLDGRIVGDEREVGVERRGGFADRAADIFERCVVIGLGRRRGRSATLSTSGLTLPSTRSEIGRASEVWETMVHLPSAPCSSSRSIRPICEPQKPAMTAGLPASVPFSRSAPSRPSKSLEFGNTRCWWPVKTTSMPSTRGELQRGVFGARAGVGGDAGVGERDDQIGAFGAHLGDVGLGGLDDVAGIDLAGEVGRVPGHDLGRQEADEAELDGEACAGAVGDLLFDDLVGRDIGGVGERIGAERTLGEVGRNDGEVGAGERLVEEIEAVVELVVAERADFVAERVHGGDDRVRARCRGPFRRRHSRPSGCPG